MNVQEDTPKGPMPCVQFVDPRKQPFVYGRSRGDLPHLHKSGCTYFVTFCLDDVSKYKVLVRRAREDEDSPDDVARQSEPLPSEGSCVLGKPQAAEIIEAALGYFQGARYALHAWVVMPNHVHLVVSPAEGHDLSKILHTWKSFTANRINTLIGRSGRLWQEESFDHVIRNEDDLIKFVAYTESNPVVAGLCRQEADWPFSSARYR